MITNYKTIPKMQKSQNNHLTMHLSTQVVMNETGATLDAITAYPTTKASLDNSVAKEQAIANSQESAKRNSTSARDYAKNAAGEFILDLSRKQSAFAIVKGNRTLLDKVRFNANTVNRSSDNKLLLIFDTLLACANENGENLVEYGVTEQFLSDGGDLRENLITEMKNLLLSITGQKQFTAQLKQQFKVTEATLRTIDAMFETIRTSDPVSWRMYRNARLLKKTGNIKLSAKGKVIDAETRLPLPKAKLQLTNGDSKALAAGSELTKTVKFAGLKGGFQLRSMATGTYEFLASYSGYADQLVTAYINEGVLTNIEIPLTKIGPPANS